MAKKKDTSWVRINGVDYHFQTTFENKDLKQIHLTEFCKSEDDDFLQTYDLEVFE